MEKIIIQGARLHNLKNIDINIPKNKLVVATGISGSGKSSLVFGIIFEEGRRQYLQSLGILGGLDDEDKFDSIAGLGPAIAVQQNSIRQSNTRSTVGSRTNIIALLGLLYAGDGQITCAACATPVDTGLVCPNCGREAERLQANYFSYNAPNGMCLKCSGRGAYYEIDFTRLAPEPGATLADVIERVGMSAGFVRLFRRHLSAHLATPFFDLPEEVRDELIYGHYAGGYPERRTSCLMRIFQARLRRGEDLAGVYRRVVCPVCQGYRVGPEARRVFLNGKHVGELGQMTITELHGFLETLLREKALTPVSKTLIKDILAKTGRLAAARLGYLSLYRETPSLSGGEIQRLFLNAHLDTGMDSLIYVLDEPTAGLHEAEKAELLKSIGELKALGNTVIVVEHDPNTIRMAEHIIEIGPGAGVEGGRVVYQGDLAGLLDCEDSVTGQYLSGRVPMPTRLHRAGVESGACLTIRHACTNNLKDVSVSFPLGCLVGVAGLSGSGKSSLISDTLLPLLKCARRYAANAAEETPEGEEEDAPAVLTVAGGIEGAEAISGFAEISQAPIGRNASSNPATYAGIWDKIRALFAARARAAGQELSAGHFSFNARGACERCGGSGTESIWLGGDLSIEKVCSACQGRRFNDEALSVTWRGKNIHDVLELSVSEALEFFAGEGAITPTLEVMVRTGMGYLKLGQPTPTLSGGEAQRLKLAKAIGRRRKGSLLYVLDEPTTSLSLYDTARLIELIDELVANGNSVIVIEHDPAVLAACDWIVELGPGGGAEGGSVIASGTPAALKANSQSITGRYL